MQSIKSRVYSPRQRPPAARARVTPPEIYTSIGLIEGERADLVKALKHGLKVTVVERLSKALGARQDEVLHLVGLSRPTLSRRRKAGPRARLTPQESNNVYRVASAYRAAVELFEGDQGAAQRWLNTPAKALGGESPLTRLETEAGAEQVHDLIGRMEHGVVV